jgi:hypothetical protein
MVIGHFMRLGDHIKNLKENKSTYAKRLKLPVPSITRYLRGERGLAANSIRIILADAKGALSFNDLVPNPYQGNGTEKEEATKNITL